MKIIEYNNAQDMTVEFQDEYRYKKKTFVHNFKRGDVKNPYDKVVFDVGYLGIGKHSTRYPNHGEVYKKYDTWYNLLMRCYSEEEHVRNPTYTDCTVCDEWLNYQNFAEWFENNYYDIGEGRMHLDKDIILKGNRIYSPEHCIYVPQRISMMFMHKGKASDLPTGISKTVNGDMASYNTKYLGVHKTVQEAVQVYMVEKRKCILQVANEYKNRIPQKLYDVLLAW